MKTVNTSELAKWLKLTSQRVRELTRDGILTQTSRSKYDLQKSVGAYIDELRKRASSSIRDDFIQEKHATQSIIRQQKELELARARGEVIDREFALFVLTNAITTMKNHVLAIASKCSRRVLGLKTQVEVHAVIRPACESALSEIANLTLDDLTEQSLKHGTNGKGDLKSRKTRTR